MALVLALVPALVMVPGARAQTNIDRGKPPSELFANYCAVCHKTTRGLATGRNSLTLSLFLREHYAASREQAAALAAYVISAGGNAPAPTKPERAKTEEPKNQEPKTQESKGHEGKPRPTSTAARPEPEKSGADRQPGREEGVPAEAGNRSRCGSPCDRTKRRVRPNLRSRRLPPLKARARRPNLRRTRTRLCRATISRTDDPN